MELLENRTFDEIQLGDALSIERTLAEHEVQLLAAAAGLLGPVHVEQALRGPAALAGGLAPGLWLTGLLTTLFAGKLPGPGSTVLSQDLRFAGELHVGDKVRLSVQVVGKDPARSAVRFACLAMSLDGQALLTGEAEVAAPREKLRLPPVPAPTLPAGGDPWRRFRPLIERAQAGPSVPTAVILPLDEVSIGGAVLAARQRLIEPIFVGPATIIRHLLRVTPGAPDDPQIVDAPDAKGAVAAALALVRDGRAGMLMKGSLHTHDLLHAVVARENGLRGERQVSHAFVLDVPAYAKLLVITDAAVNIQPDLGAKADIVQNAIDLARVLGTERPKVGLLSAVEVVYPKLPSTVDAAALCKMADRGQIAGGELDGPLAFDTAISAEAARLKQLHSTVPGEVDILLAPDLESGNMLFKQLIYLAGALAAGVVLGAKVPVALTSRADHEVSRLASCAIAALLAQRHERGEMW